MKKVIPILLALSMAMGLAGCKTSSYISTDNNTPTNSGGASGAPVDSTTSFIYGDGAAYIAEHLKSDYSITYKVSSTDSYSFSCTVIRTTEGYYFDISGTESLCIKNGDKYDMYYGSAAAGFVKMDGGTIDKESVEAMGAAFTSYMTQYGEFASGMIPDGGETVAGRSCDKFTYNNTALGAKVNFSYSIDKETGVCLKFAYDVAANEQSGNLTFECTEFLTGGVTLPAYAAE